MRLWKRCYLAQLSAVDEYFTSSDLRPSHPDRPNAMSGPSTQSDEENQLDSIVSNDDAGYTTSDSSKMPPSLESDFSRELYDRLVTAGIADLSEDSENNTALDLATLQRMMLFQLQFKIIKKVSPIVQRRFSNGNPLEDSELQKALSVQSKT
jgi:hypothetical protein